MVYLPNEEKLSQFDRQAFDLEHDKHWQIEQYHRAIKQVCNTEKFQVRGKQATKNHLFAAIYGYFQLQRLTTNKTIMNCYQIRHELFKKVVATFISEFIIGNESLNPVLSFAVNT
ncbi:transposase [Methylobacter sp. S3L5C]|uniref:transposase n=1 Tax=Methylobacter sp. S3L5C TaxID=2839024 RepID=UPI001FACD92B|nr:transposase [Methylobacter sp. S3L5C]UOA10070.1 transposase [Methylobacter sp. S3L5C]